MSSKILEEVLAANATYVEVLAKKVSSHCPPLGGSQFLPAWMHGSIRQNMLAYPKAMRMSSAMPVGVQQMTPFARLLSRTNCLERWSGLSFITPIAAWSCSATRS